MMATLLYVISVIGWVILLGVALAGAGYVGLVTFAELRKAPR